MPYPVKHLIEGRPQPEVALPDESIQDALVRMITHDYSQLPVVNNRDERRPIGIITSDSILRALNTFGIPPGQARVHDALLARPPEFAPEDDVFDLLNDLRDSSAVLIVDADRHLLGIVTSYDTTQYFRRRVEDIMFLREIETLLRDYIVAPFTQADGSIDQPALDAAIAPIASTPTKEKKKDPRLQFEEAMRRYVELRQTDPLASEATALDQAFAEHFEPKATGKAKALDELTLNQYIELFLHKSRWDRYRPIFRMEPTPIRNMLGAVRDTRNLLSHFRIDEAAPEDHDRIRYCKDWLMRYQSAVTAAFAAPTPAEVEVVLPSTAGDQGAESAAAPDDAAGAVSIPESETLQRETRYSPLARFLQQQPTARDRIQFTFAQIEEIIDAPLPPSAYQLRAWWANDAVSHAQSLAWLEAGWRVFTANLTEQTVIFMRNRELERAYNAFFAALYGDLQQAGLPGLRPPRAAGASWYSAAVTPDRPPYNAYWNAAFAQQEFRVELYIDSLNADRNKQIFDVLHEQREAIEREMGTVLVWTRADNRRASRLTLPWPHTVSATPNEQEDLRQWAAANLTRLYTATADRVRAAVAATQPGGAT